MKYILTLMMFLFIGLPVPVGAVPGEVPVGGVLPNAPIRGLTGKSEFLSVYRGKPLIINVWASYCGPCLEEMGSLERLWLQYGEHFNVIGISIDDYRNRAEGFLARAETTFPHYIDHQLMLEKILGAKTIPLTLLIDAEGRVLQKVSGAQEWDSPQIVQTIAQTYKIDLPAP